MSLLSSVTDEIISSVTDGIRDTSTICCLVGCGVDDS